LGGAYLSETSTLCSAEFWALALHSVRGSERRMKGGWETERERRKGERKLMETAYCDNIIVSKLFSAMSCGHGDIPPTVLRQ